MKATTSQTPADQSSPTLSTAVYAITAPDIIARLEKLLAEDGIFAAPTDTVYGLFGRYASPAALARIYAAKDRPPQKAIPVLIGARDQLAGLVQMPLHPLAATLMARFWPGPLTLVLPAQPHLPPILTAGAPTIAVRMPAHAALCRLLVELGPLAATSANRSGHRETHSVEEVLAQLAGRIPIVLRAAPSAITTAEPPPEDAPAPNLASTIVDLADLAAPPRILREGPLGTQIRALLAAPDA